MLGIFTDKPDYRPYSAPPPSSRLGNRDRELYDGYKAR
jgi:hypothetical protein